ncbi:MAG: small multi-drug export protein [Thermoplasmata archaeon]|nr:small multi-drug export protein [Thermoplasmata archaeon]
MVPIVELRGALPVALLYYRYSIPKAYILSVVGNMIPIPFLLRFFPDVERYLRRYPRWERFFNWLFSRTRRRAEGKIERYEKLGLMVFVAIPLPITGAWTGTVVAYLFGIDFSSSLLYIFLGVLIAGVIVLTISLSGILYGAVGIALLVVAAYAAGILGGKNTHR